MSIGIRRTIECSEAELNEIIEDKRVPLKIKTKTNVTGSVNKGKVVPNIQEEEYCVLEQSNKLSIAYTLKFTDQFHVELSNEPKDDQKLLNLFKLFSNENPNEIAKEILKNETDSGDIEVLELTLSKARRFIAEGYANRIVSAISAWRNLDTAISAKTKISGYVFNNGNKEVIDFTFENVDLMGQNPFTIEEETGEYKVVSPLQNEDEFLKLIDIIENAIFKKTKTILNIELILDLGAKNVHVYPSQLFSDDKSKKLYSLDFDSNRNKIKAGMTSQKITNALRKFDILAREDKVLSFDKYGVDLKSLDAVRIGDLSFGKTIKNFFGIIDKGVLENNNRDLFKDIVYIYMIFIKGDVFNKEDLK
jgi:hypothetical protein